MHINSASQYRPFAPQSEPLHAQSITSPRSETVRQLPINITVFLHEDLKNENPDTLRKLHFSWLEKELRDISGREVNIKFVEKSELSNLEYKNEDLNDTIDTWLDEYHPIRARYDLDQPLNKALLLTKSIINPKDQGVANEDGGIAPALDRNPAHEIGHMLGATHEDADIGFHPPSRTVFHDLSTSALITTLRQGNPQEAIRKNPYLRSYLGYKPSIMNGGDGIPQPPGQTYRFSDKNRENIRTYLSQFP